MQRKRVNSSLPSIRALLASRQAVSISGDHHPAEVRSIDIVLRHHPHDVQLVAIDNTFWFDDDRVPSSLANCTGIRVLKINSLFNRHGFHIVASAVQHSARNLHELIVFYTPIWSSLSAALSSCHQLRVLVLTFGSLTTSNAIAL
eukprot:scpid110577/ scgid20931/ 